MAGARLHDELLAVAQHDHEAPGAHHMVSGNASKTGNSSVNLISGVSVYLGGRRCQTRWRNALAHAGPVRV